MGHKIRSVSDSSEAWRAGLRAGDELLRINGEEVLDEIDYQALSASRKLEILIRRDGAEQTILMRRRSSDGLGLAFEDSMALSPRTCFNNCIFCFIAQMPPNMRKTLYVKDDDWRYSLMMGNFVTLTNVNEAEMDRIIRRHASPLFISVHTTNPELRCRMMNNRFAGNILERLTRLKENGICFHLQVVVCPEWNDKAELARTLNDLLALRPAAQSVALVPVGLTKYREHLEKLKSFDRQGAGELLDQVKQFQDKCLSEYGTRFAFPSDEFFCIAGKSIPDEEWYEGFPQIENGVGLLRRMECEIEDAKYEFSEGFNTFGELRPGTYLIPSGVSAAPHLQRLADQYCAPDVTIRVLPVKNRFFGETVTVTGLLTGGDLLDAITSQDLSEYDGVLMSYVVLRHERDLFLDDMHIDEFRKRLPIPLYLIENGGYSLYKAFQGDFSEEE